ncbi:MAG: hypothetical protein HY461_03265 [Parcubacteria group bacterium]|nr:hypothetical protein [Parcubacteria group bacterium]
MKFHRLAGLAALGLLLITPLGAAAGNRDTNDGFVYISSEETIDGNLYRAGEIVQVSGTVNGDVVVAGGVVKIIGNVAGDVIAVGGRIYITGPVQGNVRVAGGEVHLDGVVGKNVTVFGGNIYFGPESAVGLEVLAMGGSIDFDGQVGKDVRLAAGMAVLSGTIGQDAQVSVGERLVIQPSTVINGDLNYRSSRAAEVMAGATINGAVDYSPLPLKQGRSAFAWWFVAIFFIKLLSLIVLGLLMLWLVPRKLEKVAHGLTVSFGSSLGWGFITAIVVPVIALILALTVIGLPIAFVLMAGYFLTLVFACVVAAFWVGSWCLARLGKPHHGHSARAKWAVVLGAVIIMVGGLIPVLGWLAVLVLMLASLGSLVVFDKEELKKWK